MEHVDIAVIGGGIAGLAAAFRVTRLQPDATVVVLEAATCTGGRLGATRIVGRTVDTAADAFLARVPGAVELATELGLGDDLVAPATGQASVVIDGRLRPLPSGLVLGVPTDLDSLAATGIMSAQGLRDAQSDLTVGRPLAPGDRSVAEAVGTHLGAEVVERLVDPLLGGISAAHTDRLSVEAVSPLIATAAREPHLIAALIGHQATQSQGQIGMSEQRPVFLAPRDGVHELVSRLTSALGDRVRSSCHVTALTADGSGWRVDTGAGPIWASQVILAVPAYGAASLLDEHRQAAGHLSSIRYASVALVVMAYRSADAHLPDGSGMLVPRREARLVTAASWWDQKWPHLRSDDHVLVRASVGRIDDTRFQSLNDTDLVAAVHADLAAIDGLQLAAPPVDSVVARWSDSFAQYDVGHLARVDRIEAALPPGVHLAGALLRGVGLPACIRSADAAAARAVRGFRL